MISGQITKKIIISLICALAMVFVLPFAFTSHKEIVNASMAVAPTTNVVKVEKIKTTVKKDNDGNIVHDPLLDETSSIVTYNHGEFVYIDNTNLINANNLESVETEYIRVSLISNASEGKTFEYISASASLNDTSIVINNVDYDATGTQASFVQEIWGLNNEIKFQTVGGQILPIASPLGNYEFNFVYRERDNLGNVSGELPTKFNFSLLTKNDCENTKVIENDTPAIVPAYNLANTLDTDLSRESTFLTRNHLFNFNNFYKATIEANAKLEYPTISYDITKYNLSWTKKVFNKLETVTSSVVIANDLSAVVTFTSVINDVSETFTINVPNIDTNPIITLRFEDIGEYEFTYNYLCRTKIVDTLTETVTVLLLENQNLAKIEKKLNLYGFQLKYAQNQTGSEELKSENDYLFADITNINKNYAINNPVNFYVDESNEIIIPKTNQAPLWFDYIGQLNGAYYYYFPNTSTLDYSNLTYGEKIDLKKNTYFSESGLYVVILKYRKNLVDDFTQIFAFEIKNMPPQVTISANSNFGNDDNELTQIYNNSFTNKDVTIAWKKDSPFNANIRGYYTKENFDNDVVEKDIEFYSLSAIHPTKFSQNGHYTLKIHYGNSNSTYSTYKFTIDKENIDGLKFTHNDVDYTSNMFALDDKKITGIINGDFNLKWNDKKSGADIFAQYQALLIVEDESYDITNLSSNLTTSGGNSYLWNGYHTSQISSLLNAERNITAFTNQALYLFKFFDEAGNTTYKAVILDRTTPVMHFEPYPNNRYNIIDEDTIVTFGTHKTIKLDYDFSNDADSSLLKSFYNQDLLSNKLLKTNLSNPLITIALDSKTIQEANYESQLENAQKTSITNASITCPINNSQASDEYFYQVTIHDISNVIPTELTGYALTKLEVNLDKSQVLAHMDSLDYRLYNNGGSNKNLLFLNFYPENDDYIVEQLSYDFYPLTIDKTSANYPYAEQPTITDENLLIKLTDDENGKKRTDYINKSYSSILEKEVTQAGKYVVKRVYALGTVFTDANDPKRTKKYTFYVDRVKPIEKIVVNTPLSGTLDNFERIVGEDIVINLGKDELDVRKVFRDLLLSSNANNQSILVTDLMPIEPIVYSNKYFADNFSPNLPEDFNLSVEITFRAQGDIEEQKIFPIYNNSNESIIDSIWNIDPTLLRRTGIYKVKLYDRCGYDKNINGMTTTNIDPNTCSFAFQVIKTNPTGTFYGNPNENGTDKEIQNLSSNNAESFINASSTRDENLKFSFIDNKDAYASKIKWTDIQINVRYKDAENFSNTPVVVGVFNGEGAYADIKSSDLLSINDCKIYREAYYDNLGNPVLNNLGDQVYKYTITLPTNTAGGIAFEGEYKITLHYYGDKEDYYENAYYTKSEGLDHKYVSYYENMEDTLNIVVDKTAPNFNLIRLVKADRYLPESTLDPNVVSKNDIISYAKNKITNQEKKIQIRNFLRTYTFALPEDFVFAYAYNDDADYQISDNGFGNYKYPLHDTQFVYYRKYDKYTTNSNNQQSYINSDSEFANNTEQNFDMSNGKFTTFSYADISTAINPQTFSDKVKNYGYGYYEIIEIDQAGNQTIYTVYIDYSTVSATFAIDEENEFTGSKSNTILSLDYEYILKSFNNLDDWSIITLFDETDSANPPIQLAEWRITNATDISIIIEDIKNATKYKQDYKITGANFAIKILDRFSQEDIIIYLKRPGEKLIHTIEEGALNFVFTVPDATSSTWIENLIVKQYDYNTESLVTLISDINKKPLNGEFSGQSFEFPSGTYYFYLIDNFGRGKDNPIYYIFNIPDKKELQFSGLTAEDKDGITVTSEETSFVYQKQLYTARVYINDDESPTVQNDNIIISEVNNIITFKFLKQDNIRIKYRIVIDYNTQRGLENEFASIEEVFIMDTIMPEFVLTDINFNDMNYLLEITGSTSKEIFINWQDADNYPVKVTLSYFNNIETKIVEIQKNFNVYNKGKYTLTMENTLGNKIVKSFYISENTAILYDVLDSNNNLIEVSLLNKKINISELYNGENVTIDANAKVYVSILPMHVIANELKSLRAEKQFEKTENGMYTIQIYKVYGNNLIFYEEYIVLLQFDSSALSLNGFKIGTDANEMTDVTSRQITSNKPALYGEWDTTLTLNNIIGATETWVWDNFVFVNLYYNDSFVNTFNVNNLTFKDNGVYKLYFTDIAGKQYTFKENSITANYFTITLNNNVSFKINGKDPINYALYNGEVTMNLINSNYDASSFALLIYYNGTLMKNEDFYDNGVYKFTKYGNYELNLSAKINTRPIFTKHSFTIISENEAKTMHHFAPIVGYEVVKVMKNDIDITEALKAQLNVVTITDFSLHVADGEEGHYNITVQANTSQMKPIQTFTYNVWLNTGEIFLKSSIPFGKETTKKINIKFNKFLLHQEFGNVVIKITGMDDINIFDVTEIDNKFTEVTLTKNLVYFIQFETESGSLLASYKVTKLEPLNAVAIITIIGASIVVLGIIIMFILYRTKMKVR